MRPLIRQKGLCQACASVILYAIWLFPVAATAASVRVDFDDKGTFQTSSWKKSGLEITGSSMVQFLDLNGIGVVGQEDNMLDPGESLTFSFAAPVEFVRLHASAIGNLGGIQFHSAAVSAFAADGMLIGTVLTVEPFPHVAITGLFGGAPLSSFSLLATEDSYRFSSIEFVYMNAVPEPHRAALTLCGLLAIYRCVSRGRSQSGSFAPRG